MGILLFCCVEAYRVGGFGWLAGIRRGGNIPSRAFGSIVPGFTFLNCNKDPSNTC